MTDAEKREAITEAVRRRLSSGRRRDIEIEQAERDRSEDGPVRFDDWA